MKEKFSEEFRALKSEISDYMQSRLDLTKLHIAGELSKFFSAFISRTIGLYLLFFVLLFFSLALAFKLSDWLQSSSLGFVIVGLGYLIILLIFWSLRKRVIQRPIIKRFLSLLFPNFDEYEK